MSTSTIGLPEGMRMYAVDFKMKGTVNVPAHDVEEAKSRAMSDAILPGLSHYDVETAEVTEVVPRRGAGV